MRLVAVVKSAGLIALFFLLAIQTFAAFIIPPSTRVPMRPVGQDLISDMVQDGIDTPLSVVPLVYGIGLTWSTPTLRMDGSPLLLIEISGYEINDNGTIYLVARVNTHTILAASSGAHVISIRTVGTDGQVSPWSTTIVVTI